MQTRSSHDDFLNKIIQNWMVRSAKSKVDFWKIVFSEYIYFSSSFKKISISGRCVTPCHRKQAEWISGKVRAGNVCGVWAFLPLASERPIKDFLGFRDGSLLSKLF